MLSPLLLAVASSYAGTALVGPKAMATNVSSWKDTAVRGHCGPTTEIGDCSAGASGSFGGRDWSSWSKAAHWCLQRCARCARCQFISVSLAERDCSWFASCSKLHDSPRIFRSGPALPKPSEALQLAFHTGLSFNSSGMRLAGPRSSCYVALGLLSAPTHQQYRSEARQTWLRAPNVGQSVHVHFVIRAGDLTDTQLTAARSENREYRDMLMLEVGTGGASGPVGESPPGTPRQQFLRGRIVALYGWLKRAVAMYPDAAFISTGEDDVYVITARWEEQLRFVAAGTVGLSQAHAKPAIRDAGVIHGLMYFASMDSNTYTTSMTGYAPPKPDGKHTEGRCYNKPRGAPRNGVAADCHGPFPFPAGLLSSMSAGLAASLVGSAGVAADVAQLARLDDEGKAARDYLTGSQDSWLGYALHRYIPDYELTFVMGEEGNWFHGKQGWAFAAPEKAPATTFVFHHGDHLRVHRLVQLTNEVPSPQLRCDSGLGEASVLAPQEKMFSHVSAGFKHYRANVGHRTGHFCYLFEMRDSSN
jgi:hypothetical protein